MELVLAPVSIRAGTPLMPCSGRSIFSARPRSFFILLDLVCMVTVIARVGWLNNINHPCYYKRTMELRQQIKEFYFGHLQDLPVLKQFHFASRLAAWYDD